MEVSEGGAEVAEGGVRRGGFWKSNENKLILSGEGGVTKCGAA